MIAFSRYLLFTYSRRRNVTASLLNFRNGSPLPFHARIRNSIDYFNGWVSLFPVFDTSRQFDKYARVVHFVRTRLTGSNCVLSANITYESSIGIINDKNLPGFLTAHAHAKRDFAVIITEPGIVARFHVEIARDNNIVSNVKRVILSEMNSLSPLVAKLSFTCGFLMKTCRSGIN